MEAGDSYAIKDEQGQLVTVKKQDVEEIPQPKKP